MMNFLWIAVGGALGAMARYALSDAIQKWIGPGFAWGTLSVNLLGCFLIGLSIHIISSAGNLPHEVRFLGVVGFLGAFTTFSTFSLETINFLRDGQFTVAAGYVLVSNLVGVGLCFLGLRTGHWLLGHS